MERRSYERLTAILQARLFYGNIVYTGTVINLSENGLFISTRVSFPVNSVLIAVVLQNGHTFRLPIKIKRVARSNAQSTMREDNGIGVALLNPPADYLDFVNKCKSASSVVHS